METAKICPICKQPVIKSILMCYPPKYQRKCGCGNKITDNKETDDGNA